MTRAREIADLAGLLNADSAGAPADPLLNLEESN